MLSILYRLSCVMAILMVIEAKINQDERQALLDGHNYQRAQLALGKVPGEPKAADMTLMDYDLKIEARAQAWSDTCPDDHDPMSNRMVAEYKSQLPTIGQNGGFNSLNNSVTTSLLGWWEEYKLYSYESNNSPSGGVVGHYTQMAWAESTVIGCGTKAPCETNMGGSILRSNVYCNFGVSGNRRGAKPYVAGAPCSKCPDGYNMCMGGALCARPDQCKAIGANCKCVPCENGGTLQDDCSCKCANGWYGSRCQRECKNEESFCDAAAIDCATDVKYVCQKKCNACVPFKPFITKDAGGVISRIQKEKKIPAGAVAGAGDAAAGGGGSDAGGNDDEGWGEIGDDWA